MPNSPDQVTLSIVSHGQGSLVHELLKDLANLPQKKFQVIITTNLPEDESLFQGFSFPLRIIRNSIPKGFGGNHNAAFEISNSEYFVIVNPDIRLDAFDLKLILGPMSNPVVGAVAPVVVNGDNFIEDSVRKFPTVARLFKKVLFRNRSKDYYWEESPIQVDWVAGMFIVFRREAFLSVCGFDHKRFFMYYEDVDICKRLHLRGWTVILNPQVQVKHYAQRASHRNLQHFKWHITSVMRYLTGI
jgi:N-acetylglucosaminyl-diphospho-decaprenol L-rhamnosyltransferase